MTQAIAIRRAAFGLLFAAAGAYLWLALAGGDETVMNWLYSLA